MLWSKLMRDLAGILISTVLIGCSAKVPKMEVCRDQYLNASQNQILWEIAGSPGSASIEAMKQAIECGADVNAPDTIDGKLHGWTPLLLVAFGAVDHPRNDSIWSAESIKMLDVLLEHGAKLDVLTPEGANAIELASRFGRTSIVEYLIKKGCSVVNTTNHAELSMGATTPLHRAVACGKPDLVNLLLAHGAEVNVISDKGETPLDRAKAMVEDPQQVGTLCTGTPEPKKVLELLMAHGSKSAIELEK